MVDTLEISLEVMQESSHKLCDILYLVSQGFVSMSINEGILEPVKDLWQALHPFLPHQKEQIGDNQFPPTGFEYFFTNHISRSLVHEKSKQPCPSKSIPRDKEPKKLDILGRKV